MTYARIAGVGSFLPEKVVSNKDLEKIMDTSDEWIQERTGIKRRHIAGEGETTGSMGLEAAKRAMEMAGVSAEDIDLIILGTATPDKVFPSTACIIQRRLGAKQELSAVHWHPLCHRQRHGRGEGLQGSEGCLSRSAHPQRGAELSVGPHAEPPHGIW